ncbi:MAG: peptide-modifying radical SAM enzyme CbpB [Euryarchaeota archaeon]|nr:peptide-modifying radical SAM enzyme CbpB [Euryarchaeota archaeon]
MQEIEAGGRRLWIEPESVFWGWGELEELERFYERVRDALEREMHELRFGVEPVLLYLNPTDACNRSCSYCYLPREHRERGRSMSREELMEALDTAAENLRAVVFHGSEPMLQKGVLKELMDDYRRELSFGIQTNGTLLEEEDVDYLVERDVSVGLSLDSPREEVNDSLRGEGHFRKVAEVLEWFSGYSGLCVITTITSRNCSQLAEMVEFLHSKGVGRCLMNPVRGTQEGARELMPEPQEMADSFIAAVERAIALTKQTDRRIVVGDFANIMLGILAPSARVLMCDISPCGAGRRFFAVTADGTAYPCGEFIGMREFAGGSMLEKGMEVLHSPPFRAVRDRKVEGVEECSVCEFRHICGNPCPAELHAMHGSMNVRSHYCEYYVRIIRHAFEVIVRGDTWRVLRREALRRKYGREPEAAAGV